MTLKDTSIRKGVYICQCGGNISDVVNCEEVAAAAEKMPGVIVSRVQPFMCSDPSQGVIIDDIRKNNLNRIVIASCSPSLHELTFRNAVTRAGLNPYLYEHVNIREQVSWVHCTQPDRATEKAIRLVRAAVNKVEFSGSLTPIEVPVTGRVLVIGGGIAGLRAALDAAERGLQVTLVEKSPFLGGRMAQLAALFPAGENSRELLGDLITRVVNDRRIEVLVSTDINGVEGYVGNFNIETTTRPGYVKPGLDDGAFARAAGACTAEVRDEFNYGLVNRKALYRPYSGCYPAVPAVDMDMFGSLEECRNILGDDVVDCTQGPVKSSIRAGAIIVATGFDPYTPGQGEFGFGDFPGVITLPQLKRLLDPEGPSGGALTMDGKEIKNIAFIHCVGSRQVDGIHQPGPRGTLNPYCSRVCCTAALQAAVEIRERFPEVNVYDFYKDIRTYGRYHEEYYEKASKSRVIFVKYDDEAMPAVEKDATGEAALRVRAADLLTWREEISAPADLVVLAVGMEPRDITGLMDMMKLPAGSDGFLREVHPKLRPVELAAHGIFLAGTAQAPMNIDEAAGAASAAVVKASRILTKNKISLDPFVAMVDESRCDGTGLCVTQCEYTGAIRLVDKNIDGNNVKRAEINEALCKGCGSCVAACPGNAIDIAGSTLKQLYAMIDGIAG